MAVQYHKGKFPPSVDYVRLVPLIGPANAGVARFAGIMRAIPNSDVLMSPLTTQEAVLSSAIEGTQATLSEVLEYSAKGLKNEDTAKSADINEVLNYRKALFEAEKLLETLPLSQRVIKNMHHVLMQGVRGHTKTPGEYRRIPNWIGPEGCKPEDARYVCCGADHVPQAMSDLEHYVHTDQPDPLVQLAIVHAEFEAIHPFLDGNGRLGRLLVPIFLMEKKFLNQPCFYLSAYLESRRGEYYDRLLAVSRDDDWTGWIEFFLRAIIAQADENYRKATEILDLYTSIKPEVTLATRSPFALQTVDWIFTRPIFNTSDFASAMSIPKPTVLRIVGALEAAGILKELEPSSGRRAGVFVFARLLNMVEGRDAF
jgi:Fic family protein